MSKMKESSVEDKVILDLVNAPKTCPLCGRVAAILDEGCCVDCWESEILPYK